VGELGGEWVGVLEKSDTWKGVEVEGAEVEDGIEEIGAAGIEEGIEESEEELEGEMVEEVIPVWDVAEELVGVE